MEISNTGLGQAASFALQQQTPPLSRTGLKVAENRPTEATDQRSTPEQQQVSREELQNSVDAMNEFVSKLNSALQFSIDKDTGKTVVKVVDTSTDQVIRQIPSEEALGIAKALDKLKGLLIQQQA